MTFIMVFLVAGTFTSPKKTSHRSTKAQRKNSNHEPHEPSRTGIN